LPQELIAKAHAGAPLDDAERALLDEQKETAFRLISKVPRLEDIAAMVAGRVDETRTDLQQGSDMLRLAAALDELVLLGSTVTHAVGTLRQQAAFPAELLDALRGVPPISELRLSRLVRANELIPGMIVDQDVFTTQGVLLVSTGQLVD